MVCLRNIWCGAVGGRAHATAGRSTEGSLSRAAACAASAAHLVAAAGTKVVRRARRHLNTPFLLSGYCRWRGFWCDIGAASASSAGVERVFSAAGKMHGDLQKSAKDATLEHSLFAAFNTD